MRECSNRERVTRNLATIAFVHWPQLRILLWISLTIFVLFHRVDLIQPKRNIINYVYNNLFRKLTDEIHKYETRLEKLEIDMDEQETRRKSLEETLTKAQDVHEKNKRKFKLLQRSGLPKN